MAISYFSVADTKLFKETHKGEVGLAVIQVDEVAFLKGPLSTWILKDFALQYDETGSTF